MSRFQHYTLEQLRKVDPSNLGFYEAQELYDVFEKHLSREGLLSQGQMVKTFYINAYAVGKAYGGPEEGGWYYNYWIPGASLPFTVLVDRPDIEPFHDDFPSDLARLMQIKKRILYCECSMHSDWEFVQDNSTSKGGEELRVVIEEKYATEHPKTKPVYC